MDQTWNNVLLVSVMIMGKTRMCVYFSYVFKIDLFANGLKMAAILWRKSHLSQSQVVCVDMCVCVYLCIHVKCR